MMSIGIDDTDIVGSPGTNQLARAILGRLGPDLALVSIPPPRQGDRQSDLTQRRSGSVNATIAASSFPPTAIVRYCLPLCR